MMSKSEEKEESRKKLPEEKEMKHQAVNSLKYISREIHTREKKGAAVVQLYTPTST